MKKIRFSHNAPHIWHVEIIYYVVALWGNMHVYEEVVGGHFCFCQITESHVQLRHYQGSVLSPLFLYLHCILHGSCSDSVTVCYTAS